MSLPADSLIAYSLEKMKARLAERIPGEPAMPIRSGLLYMGNVHDAFPRQLLLDVRLSPLDKMAWMMIRLYAQQNEGAIFPSYDELQLQLASPHKGKASRETVSRVLLMLRITGWLSLCKRVRDEQGRVRGNIYAQHDEPLTLLDAEALDPGWLDTVAQACRHKNATISQTARAVLLDIRDDPMMRHRHSHISLIEQRLGGVQTPRELAARQGANLAINQPSSDTELAEKIPGSASELSHSEGLNRPSSETELNTKSVGYTKVRQPNHYVRNITQSVMNNTYVAQLPENLVRQLKEDDIQMLTKQLQALPEESARQVVDNLNRRLAGGQLANPVGWLLTVMKRAREGQLFAAASSVHASKPSPVCRTVSAEPEPMVTPSAPEHVHQVVAEIRRRMAQAKSG